MSKTEESGSPVTQHASREKKLLVLLPLIIILLGCLIFFSHILLSSAKPDILVITVDTLRADHLGSYGYFRNTTPFLDSFSREGILFSDSVTVMSHTVPAHVSIFTGKYPRAHKVFVNGSALSPDHQTLARILKKEGYTTAAVVGSQVVGSHTGLNQGFGHFDDDFGPPVIVPMQHTSKKTLRFERRAGEVNRAFFEWFDSSGRRPLFAWLHYWDPHFPYSPPHAFQSPFTDTEEIRGRLERAGGPHLALEEVGGLEKINGYDNEVAYVDSSLRQLMEGLKSRGIYDDALILITSDHGEGLGDHEWWSHGLYLYEEQVKVPFILRLPRGEERGTRVTDPIIGVDVMPTVLDFLGIEFPPAMDGMSLIPFIEGEASSPNREVFLERRYFGKRSPREDVLNWAPGRQYCLREPRWKYFLATEEQDELYDLRADPGERQNRAALERDVAQRMNARLRAWISRYGPDPRVVMRIDEKTRKAIEALGYVLPASEASGDEQRSR